MSAMMKFIWLVLCLCFFGYCAYLAIHNSPEVSVQLWPTAPALTQPLWLIMLASFSLGLILMALTASLFLSKARLRNYALMKKITKLTHDNDDLQIRLQDKIDD